MLKRDITYTTFDDETITETFYFHLSKAELFELNLHYENGLAGFIRHMGSSNNNKVMFDEFKRIILLSYGQRTPDGKSFLKSEESRNHFEHSPAFDALLMQFLEGNDQDIANFIIGIVPKDLQGSLMTQAPSVLQQTPPAAMQPPPPPNPQAPPTEGI